MKMNNNSFKSTYKDLEFWAKKIYVWLANIYCWFFLSAGLYFFIRENKDLDIIYNIDEDEKK